MSLFVGIDPGYGGAIARWDSGAGLDVYDMPLHTLTVNGKRKSRIDLYTLATWVDVHLSNVTRAVIEEPNALPGQGVVSMFNFGFACGVVQAMVASMLIPVVLFKPSQWKAALGIPGGPEGKDAARRKASQLFPTSAGLFARKQDHGRAEAALLAWYGERTT